MPDREPKLPPADRPVERLLAVMARLRDPEGGCPWDLEQTFRTIVPHTIEEAYEVAHAIEAGDWQEIKDELGDLLFQVIFYAQMAAEEDRFDFGAIAAHVTDKMIRRHPHVFGDADIRSAEAMTDRWEADKAAEREAKAAAAGRPPSVLDGVLSALPALPHAVKLTRRAARVGFDWPDAARVLDKLDEEVAELRTELDDPEAHDAREDELGDLLFVVANLARKLEIDPEQALRRANAKFERRFRRVEELLRADGRSAEAASLEEMEARWVRAKGEVG